MLFSFFSKLLFGLRDPCAMVSNSPVPLLHPALPPSGFLNSSCHRLHPKIAFYDNLFSPMFWFCCFLRGWHHLVLSPAYFMCSVCLLCLYSLTRTRTLFCSLNDTHSSFPLLVHSYVIWCIVMSACLSIGLFVWSHFLNVCLPINLSTSNGSKYEYQGNVPPLFSSILTSKSCRLCFQNRATGTLARNHTLTQRSKHSQRPSPFFAYHRTCCFWNTKWSGKRREEKISTGGESLL